jgi:hypothetical protein
MLSRSANTFLHELADSRETSGSFISKLESASASMLQQHIFQTPRIAKRFMVLLVVFLSVLVVTFLTPSW